MLAVKMGWHAMVEHGPMERMVPALPLPAGLWRFWYSEEVMRARRRKERRTWKYLTLGGALQRLREHSNVTALFWSLGFLAKSPEGVSSFGEH